jgi:Gpi18-like mannosyltransferase
MRDVERNGTAWSAGRRFAFTAHRLIAAGCARWLRRHTWRLTYPQWLRPDRVRLALVLLAAVLVRLVLAPRGELLWDLETYVAWGNDFLKHPADVYTVSQANYPPLTLYLFGGVVALYNFLAHLLHQPAALDVHLPLLSLLAKLPTLLADVGVVALLYALLRRAAGEGWALGAAAAYALSPAVLLDGVVWGQTDGIPVFFLLLCLVAVFAGRPGWAGVAFAAAVMLKPQPIVFAPVLLVYLYRTSGWRSALLAIGAAGAAVLAICAPYLVPPHPGARPELLVFYDNTVASFHASYLVASQNAMAPPGAVTWNAYNLWWLLGAERSYQAPLLGPFSASTIGTALFVGLLALALAGVWRDQSRERLYAALALVAVGFFAVTTLQHERYMFQALAFLLLAAAYDARYVVPAVVAQLAVFLNVGYVAVWYLATHADEPAAVPWYRLGATHPALLAAIAWAVVGLCAGMAALYAAPLFVRLRWMSLPRPQWIGELRRTLVNRSS